MHQSLRSRRSLSLISIDALAQLTMKLVIKQYSNNIIRPPDALPRNTRGYANVETEWSELEHQ